MPVPAMSVTAFTPRLTCDGLRQGNVAGAVCPKVASACKTKAIWQFKQAWLSTGQQCGALRRARLQTRLERRGCWQTCNSQPLSADDQPSTSSSSIPTWDVVGLGQAMVDYTAAVDDQFLSQVGVAKGCRR